MGTYGLKGNGYMSILDKALIFSYLWNHKGFGHFREHCTDEVQNWYKNAQSVHIGRFLDVIWSDGSLFVCYESSITKSILGPPYLDKL